MFIYDGFTDKGLKRDKNEDMILIKDNLFVISDGMGGHKRGEVASRMVIESLKRVNYYNFFKKDKKEYIEIILNKSIEEAHKNIKRYATKSYIKSIIGATVAGIYSSDLCNNKIAIFHLGDSRVYLVRENKISQITVDHSKYEELKRTGRYNEKQLSKIGKNMITKAISNHRFYSLDIKFMEYKKDDIYLICSDGVSDLCSNEDLKNIITNSNSLKSACEKIKETVYNRGAKDNLSLILAKVA